jgi:hypothetical protein
VEPEAGAGGVKGLAQQDLGLGVSLAAACKCVPLRVVIQLVVIASLRRSTWSRSSRSQACPPRRHELAVPAQDGARAALSTSPVRLHQRQHGRRICTLSRASRTARAEGGRVSAA